LTRTLRPKGVTAQAFETSISAKNRPPPLTMAWRRRYPQVPHWGPSFPSEKTGAERRSSLVLRAIPPGCRQTTGGPTRSGSGRPATADPIPTARRTLSGVESALFMARRIQAGLAANIRPSMTNRIPTPMRKSTNAMDLIGRKPPFSIHCSDSGRSEDRSGPSARPKAAQGFGAGAAGGLPEALPKNLKKSESGRSRKRVSLLFSPFS